MKESEKGGEIKESVDLPAGFLESQPWPIAITLIGDHQAERRSMHRKGDRKETKSLIRGDNEEGDAMEGNDEHEHSLAKEYSWKDEQIGEDPESIYMRRTWWRATSSLQSRRSGRLHSPFGSIRSHLR